jgi:hypothetical protein
LSLRGTTLPGGRFLMAGLPTIDLDRLSSQTAYFPHIVTGGPFTTAFLIATIDANTARLQFIAVDGAPLSIPLQ